MSEYYPINISESRYSGTYSDGSWVLVAGVPNPRQDTDAFAGDIPCMDFWQHVRKNGPRIEVDHPWREDEKREIVVMSGDSPGELWERYEEEIQTFEEEQDERFDWPDVSEVDFDEFEKEDKRGLTDKE